MSTELAVPEQQQSGQLVTVQELIGRIQRIRDIQSKVMKKGVDYGEIPGCGDKPALHKPGAETLLVAFQLAALPDQLSIQDLGGEDEVRYRVVAPIYHAPTGQHVANGVGECSSLEEKYKWRKAVCDAEFDDTDPDRRRLKYFKDGGTSKQIRMNKADVANTVLKMAKKRALVDGALTAVAASRIFSQDEEDMPEELRDSMRHDKESTSTAASPKGPSLPKYGPGAGIPIADAETGHLEWHLASVKKSIDDPKKARWKEANSKLAQFIMDELSCRISSQGPSWFEQVRELESRLSSSAVGAKTLASIRDGFGLGDNQHPVVVEQQQEYLAMLQRTASKLG